MVEDAGSGRGWRLPGRLACWGGVPGTAPRTQSPADQRPHKPARGAVANPTQRPQPHPHAPRTPQVDGIGGLVELNGRLAAELDSPVLMILDHHRDEETTVTQLYNRAMIHSQDLQTEHAGEERGRPTPRSASRPGSRAQRSIA